MRRPNCIINDRSGNGPEYPSQAKPLMMVPQSESNGFFNVASSDSWCDGAKVARRAAVSF